jgi:hypothetical protein
MRKLMLMCVVGAALLPPIANAENYHYAARAPDATLMVDADTIHRQGTRVIFWETMFLSKDMNITTARHPVSWVLTRYEIDCKAETKRMLDQELYAKTGQNVLSRPVESSWKSIVPGSAENDERMLMCHPEVIANERGFQTDPFTMLTGIRKTPQAK